MNELDLTLQLTALRAEYESSIIAQRKAFEAQSGAGDRAELASIAAAATRNRNEKRREYEAAVYEYSERNNNE